MRMKICGVFKNWDRFTKSKSCYNFLVSRNYSSSIPLNVFDTESKILQRKRAYKADNVQVFDYLKDEVGLRIVDRLFDVNRKFESAIDLGCGRGHVAKSITADCIGTLHLCDRIPEVLQQCSLPEDNAVRIVKKVLDDEDKLPYENNSVELVISNLYLHWVNNLPGIFAEVKRCLKNDGAFLGAMFGGDTLYELRSSLQVVEAERVGGISSHVSPFTQVADVGRLLNQAGFSLLTIDTDEIQVCYPSMFELMWDLKGLMLCLLKTSARRQRRIANFFEWIVDKYSILKQVQSQAHVPAYVSEFRSMDHRRIMYSQSSSSLRVQARSQLRIISFGEIRLSPPPSLCCF